MWCDNLCGVRLAAVVGAFWCPDGLQAASLDVQPSQRRGLEEYRGASDAVAPEPFTDALPQGPPVTRMRRRQWEAAAATASQLAEHSFDSFRRGLLPLRDHLEHLAVVYEIDGSAEALLSGSGELTRARRDRIDRLTAAVMQLEQFRQPAAAGWAADLALSRLVLTRAVNEAPARPGNASAAPAMTPAERRLAVQHYELRLGDAQVGLAAPPALVEAISWLNVSPEFKREFLTQVATATRQWNRVGAGVGRADRLLQARLDLALLDAMPRQTYDGLAVDRRAVQESDDYAARLFDARLRFYDTGTASLHDLSEAWLGRRRLQETAGTVSAAVTSQMHAQRELSLARLIELAAGTTDLRGRHLADVTFVRALQQRDQLIGLD